MLNKQIINKINDFVAQKPRTVQEIAQLISKSWHTADSYVSKISQEYGTIDVRTFRGGTRGALKIVYWNLVDKNQSTFQEKLFNKIIYSKKHFSAFDIYQYIDNDKRGAFLEKQEKNLNIKQDLIGTVKSSKKQLLIFAGDLTWAQGKQNNVPLISGFEYLIKNNIPIKIMANIDLNSLKNVEKILNLNHKLGKDLIEIRHHEQALRAFIVDNSLIRLKEKCFFKKTESYNYLFYSIYDEDWVKWMQKVFWHLFSTAISAKKRIENLKSIQKL